MKENSLEADILNPVKPWEIPVPYRTRAWLFSAWTHLCLLALSPEEAAVQLQEVVLDRQGEYLGTKATPPEATRHLPGAEHSAFHPCYSLQLDT